MYNSDKGVLNLMEAKFDRELRTELDSIYNTLIAKNKLYGDSALSPLRVFSKMDSIEQLRVRIDDKISRITAIRSEGLKDSEDSVFDLIGYLLLLRIAEKRRAAETQ